MRHQNTVFHALTKSIPWAEFDRLVDKHGADYRVRRLNTKSQLLALLFAQLSGASSLREIEAGLASYAPRLYHLGAKPAARSTLADANANRSYKVFQDLFEHMVARVGPKVRNDLKKVTRIIDSTKIILSRRNGDWARFSADHCGAKIHFVYDPENAMPLRADLTNDRVNDITYAKSLPIEPGATYLMDAGYTDYGWWARLHDQGCRFVTRLKARTQLREVTDHPVPDHTAVLSDRVGYLPKRLAYSRTNPMSHRVREITVRLETGKTIRIVSNDLTASATEIADLYKQRWQIELFFKWIKQNLRIKRFVGLSENAIRIQIFTALIAYVILKAAKAAKSCRTSASTFARLVTLNIMQRRPIEDLQKPYLPPPIDHRQISLPLART